MCVCCLAYTTRACLRHSYAMRSLVTIQPEEQLTGLPVNMFLPLSLPPSLSRHPCVCERVCVAIPYKAAGRPQSFREMENKEGPKRGERSQMKRESREGGRKRGQRGRAGGADVKGLRALFPLTTLLILTPLTSKFDMLSSSTPLL